MKTSGALVAAVVATWSLAAASALRPSPQNSFGAPYNPNDQGTGLCKDSSVLRREVESLRLVRLESMANGCTSELLAAIVGGTSQVWLGLRETSVDHDHELVALQKVLPRGDLMESVAGIHVSYEGLLGHENHPSWHALAQYVGRVRSLVHQSHPNKPVVVSDAVTHSSRRVNHNTSTTVEVTTPVPDTTTAAPEPTPALSSEPEPTPQPVDGEPSAQQGGDDEDGAVDTAAPTPASTSYFGAGCPETEIKRGDSSRAILARVCPGYRGPCNSTGAPTMWTVTEHTQCPKLLRIGDSVRVCCTLA